MIRYMHLLDGKPAFFYDGMICYADIYQDASELFVGSLRTIRRQQERSNKYRADKGWDTHCYTYMRIRF